MVDPRPSLPLVWPLLAALACGGSATPEETETTSEPVQTQGDERAEVDPRSTEVPPTLVTLVEPGDGEGQVLRLRPEAGSVQRMTLRQQVKSMSLQLNDQQLPTAQMPPVETVFEARVVEVDEGGAVRREWRVLSLEVHGEGEIAEHLRQQLAPLTRLTGWDVIDPRGRLLAADWAVAGEVAPELQRSLEQTRDALRQLVPPLPEEPVAVGAQWRAESPIQGSFRFRQVATYTLKRVEGEVIDLEVGIAQSAEPQPLPSDRPDLTAQLVGLESSGRSTVTFDLRSLATTSEFELELVVDSEVTPDGQAPVQSRMSMTLAASSAPAPQ